MGDVDKAIRAMERVLRIRWNVDESRASEYARLWKEYRKTVDEAFAKVIPETRYPFFDVCELFGIEGDLPRDVAVIFDQWASEQKITPYPSIDICRWYVKSCYFSDELDMFKCSSFYEPMIELFELGCNVHIEHGYICFGLASIPFAYPRELGASRRESS